MPDIAALVTPPKLLDSTGAPANGEIYVQLTSNTPVGEDIATPTQVKGLVTKGVFTALNGTAFNIPVTPVGQAARIFVDLREDARPGQGQIRPTYRISRTVTVPNQPTVTWDELVDVVPVNPDTDYAVPAWVTELLEEAAGAAAPAIEARDAAIDAQVAAETAAVSVPSPASITSEIGAAVSPKLDATAAAAAYAAYSKLGLAQIEAQRAIALRPWWAALANRDFAPAVIRFGPGDSITEGQGATTRANRWVERTRDQLRTKFPTTGIGSGGGVGWIDPYQAANSFGQPASISAGLGTDTGFGLSRRTYKFDGPTKTWTITVTGTAIDVHWVRAGTGTASVKVDGVETVINFGGGVEDGKKTRISLGAAGPHTIVIAGITGTFYFAGIMVYNGDEDKGIHTYANGSFGQSTTYFLFDAPKPIQAIQPHLFVIALSINDYAANALASTAKANIQTIIANCKLNTTKTPSFVLMPYWLRNGTYTGSAWTDFVRVQHEIAAEDPTVAVLDLNARMPASTTDTLGFYTDFIHPTNMGHAFMADQLTRFLSPM